MQSEYYFLPRGYVANPAVSFDQNEDVYWDQARVENSLAYQAAAYDWALSLVRQHNLTSIADVGCGSAAKLARLHSAIPTVETWGLDQPNAIKLCQSHYSFGQWFPINLDCPDSLPEKTFDLIISSDVIEHLENPDSLLDAIRRMSHSDTLVLISTPERVCLRGFGCLTSPNLYHVREWSRTEFSDYLVSRGAKILEHKVLPAFDYCHNMRFFKRALRRWVHLKSIAYNQVVLMRMSTMLLESRPASWE